MDEIATTYLLKKKGIYYFLTKYVIMLGLFIIFSVILIDSISYNNTIKLRLIFFTLFISIFFLLCQVLLSRIFPHGVEIFTDKIKFIGPWGLGKQIIEINLIKSIVYNDETLMVIPKWPSFNRVIICRSFDPEKEIRKKILNVLKGNPEIKFVESAYI